jgi:hypothetical protein
MPPCLHAFFLLNFDNYVSTYGILYLPASDAPCQKLTLSFHRFIRVIPISGSTVPDPQASAGVKFEESRPKPILALGCAAAFGAALADFFTRMLVLLDFGSIAIGGSRLTGQPSSHRESRANCRLEQHGGKFIVISDG